MKKIHLLLFLFSQQLLLKLKKVLYSLVHPQIWGSTIQTLYWKKHDCLQYEFEGKVLCHG
jgi:hypothetical protein